MDPELVYVKQRYRNYFAKIVEISQNNLPPGTNAANGWFRQHMLDDPGIAVCGAPSTIPLSGDARKLLDIYSYLYAMIQRGFQSCENVWSSGWKSGPVLFDNIAQFADGLISMVSAIFEFVGGDADQASRDLAQGIRSLINDVKAKGPVWNGTHMSGWVSVFEHDAAVWTISQLDTAFPVGTATDAGRIAAVVRGTLQQISRLATQGHDPWLKAEWQVQYQAILSAGFMSLDVLK